jgi:peptidyl-prolyl cis-trans isomerase C
MRKTIECIVLLGALAPLLVSAASSESAGQTNAGAIRQATGAGSALFTNTIVAKGKGVSVTQGDLDEELIRIKSTLAAQGRGLPDDLPMIERQVLDSLISKQLLLVKTTDADRAKGRAQFETSLQKFKTNGKLSEEEFNQRLSQQLRVLGVNRQQWEQQSAEQAALPFVLARELNISVTDEEIRKFYDENPAKFEQPEMVRAAHILLVTTDPATKAELSAEQKAKKQKQMADLLKRTRAGEDFSKLAKEYSDDPGSKDKGGEYTFPRGQMMPEFEAAAFSLNTNQISDIVTTRYGYHIIKLYEKIPAKKIEFDKAAPDIREYINQREIQKHFPDYIQKLRKDADVQILDETLKSVQVPMPGAAASPDTAPEPAKK